MRLIDRYICRELASHALLGLAVFTFVFYVPQLVRLMDLAVRHWSNAGTVLLLMACPLPGVLTFSLPIAVLVGALIGLGRLGADSEIIALNALGLGRRRLLVPVGALAVATGLLTLGNTIWLGPWSLGELRRLQSRLVSSQTSLDVQPRVFQEEFQHSVLYVEDASASGTEWRGVFLAEIGAGESTDVTVASRAVLVPRRGAGALQLHLENGATHTYDPVQPRHYALSTFETSDLALQLGPKEAALPAETTAPEQTMRQLMAAKGADWRAARVELHRRFAFPAACLVFALLAVAVGARPRRGGRALGFVLTLLLLCGYYLLFVIGVGKARQALVPPWVGVWLADAAGFGLGVALFVGVDGVPRVDWSERLARARRWLATGPAPAAAAARPASKSKTAAARAPRRPMARFPLLVDLYILRSFAFYFALTLAGFVLLIEVFTFFELLNDIARHHIALGVVADYFGYLAPLLFYQLTPLAALVGTLASLAVMGKNNETVAFKACGISLYRISVPLVAAGLLLAGGLFALDAGFLPYANQKQDALRNEIKGRPAQTFFQPQLRWIFGEGDKIYNYQLFDADHQVFAGLNVFEMDPKTFQLRRRVYAGRAQWEPALGTWVLEEGWVRDFRGSALVRYQPFVADSFPELNEPPSYFQREVRQSYQMNWRQLGRYIDQLRQAGFDVARLSVQWHRKFAFPLLAAIIILIGIPFPFLTDTRGAIGGLAAGVGIGIVYWATSALCEAMGAVGQLPPAAAGWAPDAIFALVGLYFFLKMPT
ncbi:MAG TPA: LPS export ABC transporter permease LptF [Candidatus Acidoferrales bacterium]|nr:LPS export ABC transporter permease LptF [Candidatus Acidoferrales bacterium]